MTRTTIARWGVGIAVAAVIAGCGGGDAATTAGTGTTPSTETGSGVTGTADPAELAEWQKIELVDAEGEAFSFADLIGRPVFVENFATWCGNCRRQLGDTNDAAEQASENAVFVALSVETDLDPDDMADYAEQQGFDHIRFAVMSPEMLAAVKDAFGTTALNPPSTPHVAVAADGTVGEMVTGFDSPEAILSSLGL